MSRQPFEARRLRSSHLTTSSYAVHSDRGASKVTVVQEHVVDFEEFPQVWNTKSLTVQRFSSTAVAPESLTCREQWIRLQWSGFGISLSVAALEFAGDCARDGDFEAPADRDRMLVAFPVGHLLGTCALADRGSETHLR